MLDEILFIKNNLESNFSESIMANLSTDLFPYFKESGRIIKENKFQGIELRYACQNRTLRGHEGSPSLVEQMRSLNFASRYIASLRDNITERFDCETMRFCRDLKAILDPLPYLFPCSEVPISSPMNNIETFDKFYHSIPFIISKTEDHKRTLYFQLLEARIVMFELITHVRNNGLHEQMRSASILKQMYDKLDHKNMAEIKYFLSCIAAFPVSEAIVESWGSVIDKVISDKIAFKESEDIDIADITEKFVFIKLEGPSAGASYNRRLLKRALTLMYCDDYAKHFMAPSRISLTSKVIEKLTLGDPRDSLFL